MKFELFKVICKSVACLDYKDARFVYVRHDFSWKMHAGLNISGFLMSNLLKTVHKERELLIVILYALLAFDHAVRLRHFAMGWFRVHPPCSVCDAKAAGA
jgi:hypothetical protein